MKTRRIPFNGRRNQRGVALIIALVLLVTITLLGLSSMRNTGLQERMTANLYDRSLAFQATESALREAEATITPAVVFPTCSTPSCLNVCATGRCSTPLATEVERWNSAAFTGWQNATTNLGALVSVAPQYFIEDMGIVRQFACKGMVDEVDAQCDARRYRITARITSASGAVTVLQSSFLPL